MDLQGGNVVGIGTDICPIERIASARARHGQAFLDKVFTQAEQKLCLGKGNPDASLAARWAAKESVSKAFGTGIGEALNLTSIEVLEGPAGAPIVNLDAKGLALLRAQGGTDILLSLSHDGGLALAYVAIIQRP